MGGAINAIPVWMIVRFEVRGVEIPSSLVAFSNRRLSLCFRLEMRHLRDEVGSFSALEPENKGTRVALGPRVQL